MSETLRSNWHRTCRCFSGEVVPIRSCCDWPRAVNSPDPIYRNQQNKLRQENCRTFAALHNSTTPSQRSKALETLKGYETDLRALMAQRR